MKKKRKKDCLTEESPDFHGRALGEAGMTI